MSFQFLTEAAEKETEKFSNRRTDWEIFSKEEKKIEKFQNFLTEDKNFELENFENFENFDSFDNSEDFDLKIEKTKNLIKKTFKDLENVKKDHDKILNFLNSPEIKIFTKSRKVKNVQSALLNN